MNSIKTSVLQRLTLSVSCWLLSCLALSFAPLVLRIAERSSLSLESQVSNFLTLDMCSPLSSCKTPNNSEKPTNGSHNISLGEGQVTVFAYPHGLFEQILCWVSTTWLSCWLLPNPTNAMQPKLEIHHKKSHDPSMNFNF